MKNNKGVTLVELIVVIAAIACLLAVVTLSLNSLLGVDVTTCGKDLSSVMGKARVISMSKGDAQLTIYKNSSDGQFYARISAEDIPVKIGKSNLTIKYKLTNGTEKTIQGTDSLVLSFDRSTGAFKKQDADNYCISITVSRDTKTQTIIIVPETGKFYIQQ